MSNGVTFTREAAGRISRAVKTVEGMPINLVGQMRIRKNKGGGGASISWAKITAVTDANNYTASIWTDRNETDPAETGKALYVSDIADALAVNDWIPVQASNRTGKNYENIQQLGLL